MKDQLQQLKRSTDQSKKDIVAEISQVIAGADYETVELNADKPWGAYFRLNGAQADRFVEEFFPGLSAVEARNGNPNAELSPKILLVTPDELLSWQYHDRRAERWTFLTPGGYCKSMTDDQGEVNRADPGDVVQFACGERHRLVGVSDGWTIVAEIWQHTSDHLSDEDDIVRLEDKYAR